MWIIWIYFFFLSSEAFGEQENAKKDTFCDTFQGLKDEPVELMNVVEQPTHAFKFLPYDKTLKMSRNITQIILPCIFQNSVGNDTVWRKGEKMICDSDTSCKNSDFTHRVGDLDKYSYIDSISICDLEQPGRHLRILNATHEDAGEYFCEVKSSPPQVISKIKLEVVDTEIITANQTFSVPEFGTVTLPCEVKNLGDEYFLTWVNNCTTIASSFLFGAELYEDIDEGLKIVNGFNLQIQNITRNQAGNYTCLLDTTIPHKMVTHKVIVNFPTPVFGVEREQMCPAGYTVTAECRP